MRKQQRLLGIVLAIVAVAWSCGQETPGDRATASIGAEGGTLVGPKGSTVVVPSGALGDTVKVTAETASTPAAPPDVDTVGDTLILGPEGQQFSAPVEVTLNVDETKLPAGTSLSDVVVYSAPIDSDVFEDLGGTPAGAGKVRATTTHFSKFVPCVRRHQHDDAGTGGSGGGAGGTGGGTSSAGGGSNAAGGGSSAAGGGTNASGGGTSASGGGTSASGGGTSASGGGTSASGGGTSASGGGTSASGGGTSAAGGGTSASGGGTSASGGGTSASGGGTSAAGGGTSAAGGGTSAAGGGTSAAGGGTSAAGGGTGATGGGSGGGMDAGTDAGSADAGSDAGFVACVAQQSSNATTCSLIYAQSCAGDVAQCTKDGGVCTCLRGGVDAGTFNSGINVCASPFQFSQLVQMGCGFP